MKKTILLVIQLALFFECRLHAQGSFQNLNFEAANIPTGAQPGDQLTASQAFPGWSTSSLILFNSYSLGGDMVTINDSNSPLPGLSGPIPLSGKYSAMLFAGPDNGAAGAASISQTGLVPANAKSILRDIAYPYGSGFSGSMTVTLGGVQIAMSPVQIKSSYTVFGGDISAEAGQVEALTITQFPPLPPITPPSAIALDDIIFSPNSVPEPSTWALLLCGAGLIAAVKGSGLHKCIFFLFKAIRG